MSSWSFKEHQASLVQNYACHSQKAVNVMLVGGINNVDPHHTFFLVEIGTTHLFILTARHCHKVLTCLV